MTSLSLIINKLSNLYKKRSIQYAIGITIILFFTVSYIILLLNKYWQFEFFSADNVYFDTALWKVSHFQAPIVTHTILGKINIFGDHFHPTIFLFSLIYMVTDKQEAILSGICAVYGLSAFFGMFVGFKLIKSRLITYALVIAYFLYLGSQNALLYGFHEVDLVPLFFLSMIFAHYYDKKILFWISFILLLLTKESIVSVTICFGIFLFFTSPKKKRSTSVLLIIISIVYFIVVTKFVIPSFSGRYFYSNLVIPTDLKDLIYKLTVPKEKFETFFVSMSTFAFLPLMNLFTLPLVIQDFILRYAFPIPGLIEYELNFHYNLILAPVLLFSSIYSISIMKKKRFLNKFINIFPILLIVVSIYYLRFYRIKGPILLPFLKDFYQTTKNNKFLWNLVKHTPRDGSIMTQNHLAYIYAHNDVYLLPNEVNMIATLKTLQAINPKYIVYDLRQGQNPNNYFPISERKTKDITTSVVALKLYKIFYNEGSMYILKRIKN